MAEPNVDVETKDHCARCGELAKNRCKGCIEGLDIHGKPSPTFHCSKKCQTHHRKTHKVACKHSNYRKQLYRAGDVAQKIFYEARRAAFDIKILKVDEASGYLFVDEDKYEAGEYLFEFPKGVFKTRSYDKINEQGVSVEPHKRGRVTFTNLKASPPAHGFFKVYLKDGVSYAVDLSSAQYGHYKPVTPWKEYRSTLVMEILDSCHLGGSAESDELKHNIVQSKLGPGVTTSVQYKDIIELLQHGVTGLVYGVTNAWMKRNLEQGAADMIMQDAYLYKSNSEQFVSAVMGYIKYFIDSTNDVGIVEAISVFGDPLKGFVEEMTNDDILGAQEKFEIRSAAGLVHNKNESNVQKAMHGLKIGE